MIRAVHGFISFTNSGLREATKAYDFRRVIKARDDAKAFTKKGTDKTSGLTRIPNGGIMRLYYIDPAQLQTLYLCFWRVALVVLQPHRNTCNTSKIAYLFSPEKNLAARDAIENTALRGSRIMRSPQLPLVRAYGSGLEGFWQAISSPDPKQKGNGMATPNQRRLVAFHHLQKDPLTATLNPDDLL
jgi:hypothetical protein